jgi:hypothetical protein
MNFRRTATILTVLAIFSAAQSLVEAAPKLSDPLMSAIAHTAMGQIAAAVPEDAATFDAEGTSTTAAAAAAEVPSTIVKNACFELYNPSSPSLKFVIDVQIDPRTYPHRVLGGSIKGSICGSPNWLVSGGSIGTALTIEARRTGGGSCARTFKMVGTFAAPSVYRGTYGWDGASSQFSHTTLFNGYVKCQ